MESTAPNVSFREALRFWFRLGWISFGGPAGQIALLHHELVERRRWISEQRFLHALNYCMLLPGPEAQQLTTYLGWLMHRTRGGVAAGVLFVLPSLLVLVGLSWVYVRFGQVPWVAGIFYGIKPAVVAIVLQSVLRMGGRSLRHPLHWSVAVASFIALAALHWPFPLIIAGAAAVGALGARFWPDAFSASKGHGGGQVHDTLAPVRTPALIDDDTPLPFHARFSTTSLLRVLLAAALLWTGPMALLWVAYGASGTFTQMGLFFSKAALLTFGGAYAVLPYVVQGAVEHFQWLSAAQMMDGLALGESTPGPLIMVVAFVAYLGGHAAAVFGPEQAALSGVLAACIVTWFTFLPSFILILAGGPLVERTRGQLGFTAPLAAIGAAVVGVVLNLAVLFGSHVLFPQGWSTGLDLRALALTVLAALALMRWRRGVIETLAACGLAGLLLSLLGGG